jgi:hypothetical protein
MRFNSDLLPIEADRGNYLRAAKRTDVSDIEAAHFLMGIIPKMDSELVFINPWLAEVEELYKLLKNAADTGKIKGIVLKISQGRYKTTLQNWFSFMIENDLPIPDLLLDVLDKEIDFNKRTNQENKIENTPKIIHQPGNRVLLLELAKCLALTFPDIPYKYYAYHPQIAPILKSESISVETFEDLASEYCKQSRVSGRPRILKILNPYEKTHPHLKGWFAEIKKISNLAQSDDVVKQK